MLNQETKQLMNVIEAEVQENAASFRGSAASQFQNAMRQFRENEAQIIAKMDKMSSDIKTTGDMTANVDMDLSNDFGALGSSGLNM